jgi:small-conductance mechanosensitive channel
LIDIIISALENSRWWFFFVIALFLGASFLHLGTHENLPLKILTITSFIQLGIWLIVIFEKYLNNWNKNSVGPKNAAISIVTGLGKFLIWVIVLLLILDNLGVKVVSLLAGLGIGGMAFALASQKMLSDLFASISIMIEKPFEAGDSVNVGGTAGVVEQIGVKSTKIRAATGEEIIVSNSDLLASRVSNFKRMEKRTCTFSINVGGQNSIEIKKSIVALVKNIIENSGAEFVRGHLKTLSTMEYEFVYAVASNDYAIFMDTQEKINFAIMDAFAEKSIASPISSQKIILDK